MPSLHLHDIQTDPTVGKGEWKQICQLLVYLHRSCVSMCKNSPSSRTLLHINIPLTHAHHSFKGSLCWAVWSLGRVKGFVF